MGQLEDLQRNRIARMQNLQKGFCGDDNQDDLFKAHMDGDIHPNGKWMWVSSANGGKGDWRTIPKDGKRSQDHQPQSKPATQQGNSTLKDLGKTLEAKGYEDQVPKGSNTSYDVDDSVAMYVKEVETSDGGANIDTVSVKKDGSIHVQYWYQDEDGIVDDIHDMEYNTIEEYLYGKKPAKKEKPDFTPKYPDELRSLNRMSTYEKIKEARIKLGMDIIHDKFGDDKKAALKEARDYVSRYYPAHIDTMGDNEILRHYARKLSDGEIGHAKTNTDIIASMKDYYNHKAQDAEREYRKKKNDEYWAGAGAAHKQALEAERAKLLDERQKNNEEIVAEVKKAFPYNGGYEVEVNIPEYFHSDGRIIFKRSKGGWSDFEIDFKNKNAWDSFKDPSKEKDIKFVPEMSMSSQRVEFDGSADFERTKFTITIAAEFMKDGVADEWAKKITDASKKQRETRKRIDEINEELKKDHSDD